jgi:hypothetical protein
MRWVMPLTSVVLAAVAVGPSSAAGAVKVSRSGFGATPTLVRPGKLGVGAKGVLGGIRWSSWGGSTARGRGTYEIAGFAGEPGTGFRGRVTLTFSDRGTCKGRLAYRRLTIRSPRPIGGLGRRIVLDWC